MSRAKVRLVVTGQLEHRALAPALGRLFPQADFAPSVLPAAKDLRGFTSARVDPAAIADQAKAAIVDGLVDDLAGALRGPRREEADLVVLIDDLELANRGNEARVLQAVREAVHRHLARRGDKGHFADLFRERASVHFFDPMVEAYLIASTSSRGVISIDENVRHRRDVGAESFEVLRDADPTYFDEALGECSDGRSPKGRRCPWQYPAEERARHPKAYLKYLRRGSPPRQFCSDYKETEQGVAALAALQWSEALETPDTVPFLDALVEDLSQTLGPPALEGWVPCGRAWTSLARAPLSRVMRNV